MELSSNKGIWLNQDRIPKESSVYIFSGGLMRLGKEDSLKSLVEYPNTRSNLPLYCALQVCSFPPFFLNKDDNSIVPIDLW